MWLAGNAFGMTGKSLHAMKRNLLYILLFAFTLSAWAQQSSYDRMWEKLRKYAGQDLPASALNQAVAIRDKALAEQNDDEFLKACVAIYLYTDRISPEKGDTALQAMETAALRETDEVRKALWNSVLGQVFARRCLCGRDTADAAKSRAFFKASVRPLEKLAAASTMDFPALFLRKKGSGCYRDDLLSVVTRSYVESGMMKPEECCDLLARVGRHYRQGGCREAALLCRLDSIGYAVRHYGGDCGREAFKSLCQTAKEFEGVPLNVETYIRIVQTADDRMAPDSLRMAWAERGCRLYAKEKRSALLRHFLDDLKRVQFQVDRLATQGCPGQEQRMYVSGRNLRKVDLRIYPTDLTGEELAKISMRGEVDPMKYAKRIPVWEESFRWKERPPYEECRDSMTFTLHREGIYVVSVEANGRVKDAAFLHMSNVRALRLMTAKDSCMLALVHAVTGELLPDARITLHDAQGNRIRRLLPSEDGYVHLSTRNRFEYYCIAAGTDAYAERCPAYLGYFGGYSATQPERTNLRVELFTDRAIYRPGQTLHFAGTLFAQKGDSLAVLKNRPVKVTLHDAQGKEVESLRALCDGTGDFKGELVLPQGGLPGRFRLVAALPSGQTGAVSFRVDEYKRPTIMAEVPEPTAEYALGDTVCLKGKVRTYTDLPLPGARVKWIVDRSVWVCAEWEDMAQRGETITDMDGCFEIPVILCSTAREREAATYNRFFYSVHYDVTAANGETVSGNTVLQVSNRPAWLSCEWPASVCREQMPSLHYTCVNSSGKKVEKLVSYGLWKLEVDETGHVTDSALVLKGETLTGTDVWPAELSCLATGEYCWKATACVRNQEKVGCENRFRLFSETDVKPVGTPEFVSYARLSEKRDSAFVMVGSACDSVTLFYALFADGRLLEQDRMAFSDSLLHFQLDYRPEYGQSARACFAFMKNDRFHAFHVDIQKPEPEKRLQLAWTSFRSRLAPGANEEWRLRVVHPDGTPARASLLARLYDHSLDALAESPWNFWGISFYRPPVHTQWLCLDKRGLSLSGWSAPVPHGSVPAPEFTQWNLELSMRGSCHDYTGKWEHGKPGKQMVLSATGARSVQKKRMTNEADGFSMKSADAVHLEETVMSSGAEAAESSTPLRSDFAETAWFCNGLQTDENGEVSLVFRLPESLTTWRFEALAHTASMDFGRIDTVAVARKEWMLQPALPRFARSGDKVALPFTVFNLSEQSQTVEVVLELQREDSPKPFAKQRQNLSVPKGGNASACFECDIPEGMDAELWVVRMVAKGKGFSDGEERYLPILSDRAEVTRSLPFSFHEPGSRTLRVDSLWQEEHASRRSLQVETVSQPTWSAVSALPVLTDRICHSADDWAVQYYALTLSQHLAKSCPEIKAFIEHQTEGLLEMSGHQGEGLDASTPWWHAGQREEGRNLALRQLLNEETAAARIFSARDQLKSMQLPDGSWGWCRGMKGNLHVTLDVAMLLVRLHQMADDSHAAEMLDKALKYLHGEMHLQVKQMREREKKNRQEQGLDESALRYLYVCALADEPQNDDIRYLLQKVEQANAWLDLYEKAMAAVVLSKNRCTEKAEDLLQSILEYTVSSPEMGMWFDTRRAQLTASSYRIPTQVAAIEAMEAVGGDFHEQTDDMKLWLMQSRRTQQWVTPRATADALHALLLASGGVGTKVKPLGRDGRLFYTLRVGRQIVDAPSTKDAKGVGGYGRHVYDETTHPSVFNQGKPVTATFRQTDEGLVWGTVSAAYTLPITEARPASSGWKLRQRFEVQRAGNWVLLADSVSVHTGDRVRQVFEIWADRDYDFVRLASSRSACLEPVQPLSGYAVHGGMGAYRVVKDSETEWFFDKMPKGKHVFVEECHVDRSGCYATGLSEIQCVYAPEFRAHTESARLVVE